MVWSTAACPLTPALVAFNVSPATPQAAVNESWLTPPKSSVNLFVGSALRVPCWVNTSHLKGFVSMWSRVKEDGSEEPLRPLEYFPNGTLVISSKNSKDASIFPVGHKTTRCVCQILDHTGYLYAKYTTWISVYGKSFCEACVQQHNNTGYELELLTETSFIFLTALLILKYQ